MVQASAEKIKTITLIAGPTASGKSQLALRIAKEQGGLIINSDSMQVYEGLRVITARPNEQEIREAPHYLYGHVAPDISYSTGQWLKDVKKLLQDFSSTPLIFVGGTGLYFKALIEGLAEIPDVSDDVRTYWREALEKEGSMALYKELERADPQMAIKLMPYDGQRICRALEVWHSSGQSLNFWQNVKAQPLISAEKCQKILVMPQRAHLYTRINDRFNDMVRLGALNEVKALNERNLDKSLPVVKAIGVPEFGAFLQGEMTLDKAIETAKTRTRNYAKRQMTWFRNQLDESWTQKKSF